ncbi:LysR family transcriptional regulator [Hoeflea sp.]|uniref:LysR family transcriptional regulator n=1 Tax=Hoeflea sp. TaxID=1940281 RepID=UPI003B010AA1
MHRLPPLNALRAFEVAARCGSFVQAGQELGVSAAAVSLQVKNLEEHFGKQLFLRQGNRIFLTDAGEAVYPGLARVFGDLSDIAQLVWESAGRPKLIISVLPALSERWLLPRALNFRQETEVSLEIRVEADPIDFARGGADLRITYDSTFYGGYRSIPLFSDVAVPVCSPSFWNRHGDPEGTLENVPDTHLIHYNWGAGYSSEPNWGAWQKGDPGDAAQRKTQGLIISDISLAIAAARSGAGMALAPECLVAADLRSGALIAPAARTLEMSKGYVCVFPNARANYAHLQRFLAFLDIA